MRIRRSISFARQATALAILALTLVGPASAGHRRGAFRSAYYSSPRAEQITNLGKLKLELTRYHDRGLPCPEGCYAADVAAVIDRAKAYLGTRLHSSPRPAMVLDIDDTSLSSWRFIVDHDF